MKKFLKTGKKTLSVIMAIMMLMSAWVWVAPTEASAATAGNYYVEITWSVSDTKKYSNKFTGTETENGARAGMILYYKTNNGTGTEQKVYWDIGNEDQKGTAYGTFVDASTGDHTNSKTTHTTKCIISGFPTAFYATADSDYFLDGGKYEVTSIVVGKPSTNLLSSASISNKKTLWSGSAICETTTEWKYFKITSDGTGADGKLTTTETGSDQYGKATSTAENWLFPTPTTTTTYTGKVDNVSIPKSGTADVMTVKVIANDQYGVQMGTPTWSVSRNGANGDNSGISVSPTSGDSTTVKLTNAANVTSSVDTQTGTITATWGNAGSLSDTFTITDSYYTATFNYQTQNDDNNTSTTKTETRNGYHGDSITAPTAPSYYDYDELKTFSAWTPTYSSTITKDVTYTATYTSKFVDADYSAVDAAIEAVRAFKENSGAEYEVKYTYTSRMAVETAINAVIRGKGRTEQATVTGYADAINSALAALEPNKYAVIFLDKNGAILKYEKNAEYKTNVEAPVFPEEQKKYHDATNHYTYSGWDTNEYTSVIDDLVISPVYVAEAHDFVSESVSSTCVQAGTTKHTCQTCGYTYYDGGDQLGDHVWEADFTVDLEPTCVLAGSKSIHCTLCDAQKDITAIEPKGHTWESYTVAVNPTCTNIGISTRVCAEPDCRFCEHLVIDPINHNYEKTTVAPTCTAKGYDEYVCQNDGCGHSYRDNFKDTVAHTYGAWETVSEAHCGVAGVKKQTCTVENCGHVNIGSIDALEHDALNSLTWDVVVEDTCEYAGYRTKTCSKCNNVIDAESFNDITDHDYETVTTPATCTQAGYTVTTCNRDDCGYEKTTVIQPTGHKYANTGAIEDIAATCTTPAYKNYKCDVCGDTKTVYVAGSTALTHDFDETIEANVTIGEKATCTTDGSKTVKCSRCDVTTTVILPRLGHNYSEWDKTPSTNSEDGKWTRTCANCKNVETITIPKGGHNFVEDEKQYVAPTCNTKGQRVYKCDAHENCIAAVTVVLDYTQHEIAQKVENATCKANGSVKAYCSVCDKNCENPFSTTETPVVPHTLNSGVATEATCTTSGYTTYTCTANDCGFSYKLYDESKPATGHKYNAVVTTAATCEGVGLMTYTCACGDSYTADIPAKGHAYGNWQKTDATNTEDGQWKRVCGNDENHIETVVIPKGGHKWDDGKETLAPTCTTDGKMLYACKNHTGENACGITFETTIPATGHSYEAKETLAPGCTTKGEITYTCACNHSYTETIPAKGHDLTTTVNDAKCGEKGSVVITCSRCDDPAVEKTIELAAKGHIWGATPTKTEKATCEADGSKTYKCENCNETNVVVIPKLGHEWSNWTVTKDSTNTEKGTLTRTCTRGCKETAEIPAGNHKLVVDNEKSTPASCKTEGTTVYKCENHTDCGITLSVTEPMLQHAVAQREIEADCKTEGKVEAYCTVCNDVLNTEIIPVKAHNFVAQTPAVEATCTTSGYTVYKCTCGDTYNVYDESKPAKGHTLVEGTSTANCTTDGIKTLSCSVCKNYTVNVNVPALGHNYVENTLAATEATCASPATKTYKCSRCTDSYTVFEGEKLKGDEAHKWGEWTVKNATESSLGYRSRTCNICGQVAFEIIPATGEHKLEETSRTEATCTDKGMIYYECDAHENCGVKDEVEIPAKGHTEKFDYKAATCDEAGYAKMVCSVESCKAVLSEETIPALGHLYGEGTVTNATCKDEGKIVYTCTRENCTDKTKTVTIPKNEKAHQYATTVTPATCKAEGSVVTKCALCNDVTTNEKLSMINHTWNDGEIKEGDAATCIKDGTKTYTCTVTDCGATKTETIAKLGHEWSKWTVTKASTNTEKGTLTRTCSRGCTETADIPAGGHNLIVTAKTDASCTAPGSVTYTCDTKHEGGVACGITVTVTLDMLQHELETTKKDATCTENGEVVTKCKNCDTTTITTIIPATKHNYEGVVTTEATCTATGTKTYTCSKCKESYTETLPKLQHVYAEESTTAPTCTASGYTTYTCKCGATYDEIDGNALGHDLVITPAGATCTQGGKIVVTCSRCNFRQETNGTALGHDYQKISSTDATCAAAATETYECTRCSASYTVSVGEKATEHSYPDAWTVVKEATPVSIGYKTRECKVCGKLEVQTINETGEHVFEGDDVVVESMPATCTENGYEIRKCKAHTDCGVTTEITLFATGHDEIVTTTAASCEGEGSIVTTCSKCTYKNTETIPALGHVWGNEKVTPATCKAKGSVEYTCTRDNCGEKRIVVIGIDKDAHKYKTTVNQASCTDDGSVITECTLCGDKTTVIIPAKGHTFTGTETPVKDASCTENGEKTVKCANCNLTETVIIPKLGHKMVAGKAVAPTCTSSGYTPYTCENGCGENYKVYDSTVVKHNYIKVENSSTATCLDGGTITMKCSLCSDEIKAAVPALGHSYGNWTTVNPTAEADGSKTRECGRCHVAETVILPKLGHNMVKDAAASEAPTCTEEGTDVYVCDSHKGDEACGYTYTVKVPAKGHSYGVGEETTKVSCDTDGVITYKCTTDGCSNAITEIVPKKGHNLSTKVNEATCEAEGSAVTTCSRCDFNITEKLAIKPHTLSLSTAYPGCEKEGYATTWCSVCEKEIHRKTLAALGHSFTGEEKVTKEATCLEKGEKTVKCSRCDKTTTVEIPATGHNYVAGEEVKATCTESGYIPYNCKNKDCTSSYRDLTSNPNGHKWNTTAVSGTKATCEKDGLAVYKCQFCEATNEVVTPKFGHSWTEWTVSKVPTADEDGEKTRTCLRGCKETVSIPAIGGVTTYKVDFVLDGEIIFTQTVTHLGSATAPVVANKESDDNYHYILGWDKDFSRVSSDLTVNAVFTPVKHSFGEWVTDKTADCKNTGLRHRVCDCGYVDEEVIAKTEHSFSEIKEEKAATCTNSGYKVLVCKNCGDTETKTINKLGHSMTYHQGYDATCDTDGVARHYSCSRCGKSFEDRAGSKELSSTVITRKYHIFIVVPGTAPTCDTDGIMDYRYCTTCGYTQHPDSIPATGHVDANRDNTCDKCGATYMQGGNIVCKCSCHKNGFINEFIYKILSFFWRLFGTNKSCECGKVHY